MGFSRRPIGASVPSPRSADAVLRALADAARSRGVAKVVLFGSRAAGAGDGLADVDVALVGREVRSADVECVGECGGVAGVDGVAGAGGRTGATGDAAGEAAAATKRADVGAAVGIAIEVLAVLPGAALVTALSPTHAKACVPDAGWLRLDVHAVDATALRRHRGPRRTLRRRRPTASDPAPAAALARGAGAQAASASSPLRFADAAWRRAGWLAIDALVRLRRGDRDEAELLLADARRLLAEELGAGRDVSGARGLAHAVDPALLRRWRAARPRSLEVGELRRAAGVAVRLAVARAREGGDHGGADVMRALAANLG